MRWSHFGRHGPLVRSQARGNWHVRGSSRTRGSSFSVPRSPLIRFFIRVDLQPGPNGAGVDRRIPFPEFDFNDSYQQFDLDAGRVTNVFATPHVLKSGCQNAHKSQQLDSTRHPTI